ncbi:DMT family transporter [Noviherbaspirillum massiliense]|uniref:DMT family transporter n=1 Tax=Noviherbaspirillum massiliense TaxID=1465823 RepID=UPI0009D9B948|nr:DMT family transporter [Noviherbaspirillum massiliense]
MQSLWMLFASFMFAIMGVCVKLASDLYSTSEIVMYRGMIGVFSLFILIMLQGGTLKTSLPWHHLWRGTVGVIALWLWFYAIGKLPLATATTLNYMAPIWIAAFLFTAGLWRGDKKFEWGLAAAILMSFVGVTLLLRPAIHADQWLSGLMGLGSGVLSALAYLQVKKLGHMGEPEYRVVFYFSATGIVAGFLGALAGPYFSGADTAGWHAHTGTGIALLLGSGICATIAQMAMTRAYRLGNTLVTANLQYTGIIFSSFWGILIWKDTLSWMGWTGIAVILVSGLTATYYNTRGFRKMTPKAAQAEADAPSAT